MASTISSSRSGHLAGAVATASPRDAGGSAGVAAGWAGPSGALA
ncbi:MAG: hypothetical protein M0Z94_11135 [Dehalococcoidales bacterium]|nr:hypothetical protein [Dehalococcoidales bacterium]